MRQMKNTISIPVIILTLGFFSLLSFAQDLTLNNDDGFLESEIDFDGRPHDYGLGKRVYGYLSEYKRLPVYNFGLGKRSHLYNFGLGKRSGLNDDGDDLGEFDEYSYNEDDDLPELELYHDDNMQSMDKRNKLYSFGLGKRLHRYDFGLGKRQIQRYDFGLGKRSQSTVNRDKLYNFGLGKRNRMYNFGLGKRPYNQGPVPSRFNFGLGKRSDSLGVTKAVISKRDVREQNMSEDISTASADSAQATANKLEKANNTVDLESHESMGHSDKSQVSKRSPHSYGLETGKRPNYRTAGGFSRQFRKPLYNFGLGKRTFSKDQTAQNIKSSNN